MCDFLTIVKCDFLTYELFLTFFFLFGYNGP